jgi:hypothetical protein
MIRLLEALVVVVNYGVEEVSEDGVRFCVRGVDADAGVRVLDA